MEIQAYPLQWPQNWPRTAGKKSSGRYQVSFAQARDETVDAIAKLGGRGVVISSNIETRRDGLPYANKGEPTDTGIAVYWLEGPQSNPQYRVLACDCWASTRANLRAINLSIEALCAIKRAGATQVLDRAYTGFTALPAGTKKPWFEVLGVLPHSSWLVIEAAYKNRALRAHPDAGGSHDAMTDLNVAYTEAKKARA